MSRVANSLPPLYYIILYHIILYHIYHHGNDTNNTSTSCITSSSSIIILRVDSPLPCDTQAPQAVLRGRSFDCSLPLLLLVSFAVTTLKMQIAFLSR